jgi:nucleotide-binding universal stress UspA family protein
MTSAAPKDRSGRQAVILVAVDGSTTSLHAEAWAANLARKQGCRLLCLFVETHPAYADVALWTGAALPLDFGAGELAKEIFEGIRDDLKIYPVHADFLVRSGDPATEIERVAEEFKVDAVVVGASMQARHRLIGSVGVRLVHDGRWPVAVVP